jgi:hypothetical protein
MKMFSRTTLCVMAFAGLALSANAQQIALTHSYSDASGAASAAPTNYVTIYAARIDGSPEQEVQSLQLRIYFNSGATSIVDYLVRPTSTTSTFTKNVSQAADATDLDFNPATTQFGSATAIYATGFPLRDNANTVPASWAPGQPTNGAFEAILITQFANPPAADAFGYTAPNAPNQSGIFVRPWGAAPSGLQLPIAEVTGMTNRQGGVLAVEMVDLDAKVTNNGVLVTWETGLEIDNAGFNVYSHAEVASGMNKLNPILIGAAGTAASYSYMDSRTLANGETRVYYVEDVDVSGLATTLHGPAIVTGGVSQDDSNVKGWDLY